MTREQRIKKWTAYIEKVVALYQKLDAACRRAQRAGALDIDGPLHEAIWHAFEGALELSTESAWLNWYIWDNDCGEHGFMDICTPADLAEVIVDEMEPSGKFAAKSNEKTPPPEQVRRRGTTERLEDSSGQSAVNDSSSFFLIFLPCGVNSPRRMRCDR